MRNLICLAVLALAPPLAIQTAHAGGATVHLTIKGGKFTPSQPHAPANTPLTIVVKNLDSAAAEFESKSLRVEKVVAPGGQVALQVRALNAGTYHFFDDFHQDTTDGDLIVE
jgi:hypothetical protein